MPSPRILIVNTEFSERSVKSNKHDFCPKNFNHVFLSKPEFESYMNDFKSRYEDDNNILIDMNIKRRIIQVFS
jgi:hypothetical protein